MYTIKCFGTGAISLRGLAAYNDYTAQSCEGFSAVLSLISLFVPLALRRTALFALAYLQWLRMTAVGSLHTSGLGQQPQQTALCSEIPESLMFF